MLDFVRFRVGDKNAFELINEERGLIQLNSTFNRFTGVISDYPKKGKLHNLEITVTSEYAYIEGSLHKFFNHQKGLKNTNYDDFGFDNCLLTINWICEYFQIDKKKTVITNLEFGFNIHTEYIVNEIIKDNIVMWNFDTHNERIKYKSNGVSKEFGLNEYKLKIYAKGEESKIGMSNLMRIELKITATRILNRLNIFSLADINLKAFESLFNEFLKQFDKLLILDSINPPNGLEFHEAAFFIDYTKFDRWNRNKKIKSRNERKKDEKKLMGIINQFSYNTIQSNLRKLLLKKYNQLSISIEKHLHN